MKKENAATKRISVTRITACFGLAAASFLAGIALDVIYRPNHITFEIRPDSKVNVVPQKGDIINWVSPDTKTVTVNFLGTKPPCAEGNGIAKCTYIPQYKDLNLYLYDCSLNVPPNVCYDPGMGGRSGTGPGGTANKLEKIEKLVEIVFIDVAVDIERLFGFWPSPSAIQPPPPAPSSTAATPSVTLMEVYAACDNSNKAAIYTKGGLGPTNSISATTLTAITWVSADPDFSTVSLNICKESGQRSQQSATCTMNGALGPASYMLVMPSCAGGTQTPETINVSPL